MALRRASDAGAQMSRRAHPLPPCSARAWPHRRSGVHPFIHLRLLPIMGFWSTPKRDAGTEAPTGRGGHGAVPLDDNKLLVFGGADRTPAGFSDLWLLELVGGNEHWTKISPKLGSGQKKPVPRSGCSLTLVGSKVYIFGGQEPASGAILDELLVLEVGSWELSTYVPAAARPQQKRPPARHSHVAGIFERDSIIVFGGAGLRGPLADVWAFSTQTQEWRCLSEGLQPAECPEPREMAAGCVISDAGLFVHGGRGAEGEIFSDVAIFDGRAGKWVLVQATPYARCAHTATNAVLVHQPQQQGQQPEEQQSLQRSQPGPQEVQQQGQQASDQQVQAQGLGTEAGHSQEGLALAGGALEQDQQQAGVDSAQPISPQEAQQREPSSTAAGAAASSNGSPSHASNVLLFGGFTGEAVSNELLQLSFVRQPTAAGGASLRVELRPVKAQPLPGKTTVATGNVIASPPARFAHSAVAFQRAEEVDIVVFGGVNQTDDLCDVLIWTL